MQNSLPRLKSYDDLIAISVDSINIASYNGRHHLCIVVSYEQSRSKYVEEMRVVSVSSLSKIVIGDIEVMTVKVDTSRSTFIIIEQKNLLNTNQKVLNFRN